MKDSITITLPDEYPWILLCLVILCFECIAVGFVVVVPRRIKYFNA